MLSKVYFYFLLVGFFRTYVLLPLGTVATVSVGKF